MSKKIVLTGGGTAGHVTPNIALMPELEKHGYTISYIGSYKGMEKGLIAETGVPYYGISTGKLRRYFDIKNFTDPFKILKGFFEAKSHLKKIRPDVIFSKGGFVSVPVVWAAKFLKIPVIIHESDMTPGLANKLSLPCTTKVCCSFPETMKYLPANKAVLSGSPIRQQLFEGSKEKGLAFCGFDNSKPVLLVMGGSLGAVAVNEAIRGILPELLKEYQIIHLCGKEKTDASLNGIKGYAQYEYIGHELSDLMACADIIVSRAGANAIFELLALKKPNILIPLPAGASRGDQILNAKSFEKQGFSYLLPEEEITNEKLLHVINEVYAKRDTYKKTMEASGQNEGIKIIIDLIETQAAMHRH